MYFISLPPKEIINRKLRICPEFKSSNFSYNHLFTTIQQLEQEQQLESNPEKVKVTLKVRILCKNLISHQCGGVRETER